MSHSYASSPALLETTGAIAGREQRGSAREDPELQLTPGERGALRLQRLAGNRAVTTILSDPARALAVIHAERASSSRSGTAMRGSVPVQRDAPVAAKGIGAAAAEAARGAQEAIEAEEAAEAAEAEAKRNRLPGSQQTILAAGAIRPLRDILGRLDTIPLRSSIALVDTPMATLDGIEGPEGAMDAISAAREVIRNARQSMKAADNPADLKVRVIQNMFKGGLILGDIAKAGRAAPPEGSTEPTLTPGAISLIEGYAGRLGAQSAQLRNASKKEEIAAIGDDMLAIGTALSSIEAPEGVQRQLISVANACLGYANSIEGIVGGREVALKNARDQLNAAILILVPLAGADTAPPD